MNPSLVASINALTVPFGFGRAEIFPFSSQSSFYLVPADGPHVEMQSPAADTPTELTDAIRDASVTVLETCTRRHKVGGHSPTAPSSPVAKSSLQSFASSVDQIREFASEHAGEPAAVWAHNSISRLAEHFLTEAAVDSTDIASLRSHQTPSVLDLNALTAYLAVLCA